MCQLTFTNLRDQELNRLYVLTQSIVNSITIHKDGFGFFTELGGINKTDLEPAKILGFSQVLNKAIVGKDPVLSHVRYGTTLKTAKIENSHPFGTKRLVLAHNGTLKPNKGFVPTDITDSEYFLRELDKRCRNSNVLAALPKTMGEFTGKFAFLIYDKQEKIFYAARGKTAELNILYVTCGKNKGYIINTNKDDLLLGINRVNDVLQCLGMNPLIHDKEKPELLKEDSIFILHEGNIEEIGKVEENTETYTKRDYVVGAADDESWWSDGYRNNIAPRSPATKYLGNGVTQVNTTPKDKVEMEVYNKLDSLMYSYGLNTYSISIMFYAALGISILEAEEEDFKTFFKYVVGRFQCSKQFRKRVRTVLMKKFIPVSFYEENNFQFPYMMIKGGKEQQRFIDLLREYK